MIDALVGHLVGDYLAQNDWMAKNKKKAGSAGAIPCTVHCLIWSFCVILFAGWMDKPIVAAVLFMTHYIQDNTNLVRRWMSLIGQDEFAGPPLGPWSIIVVDNVWHIVTLYLISKFLV